MTLRDLMLVWEGEDGPETIVADFKSYLYAKRPFGTAHEDILAGGIGVVDLDTEERADDGSVDSDLTGWFTVQIVPRRCPGCGTVLTFTNTDYGDGHRIVVWPSEDDPSLLKAAERRRKRDGKAEVIEFEHSMGRAVSYYALQGKGIAYS